MTYLSTDFKVSRTHRLLGADKSDNIIISSKHPLKLPVNE